MLEQRVFSSLTLNAIKSAVNFTIVLVLARKLGTENYGTFSVVLALTVAMRSFLDFGVQSAILTYFSKYKLEIKHFLILKLWNILQFFIFLIVVFSLRRTFPNVEALSMINTYGFVPVGAMVFMQYGSFVAGQQVMESLNLTKKHLIIHNLCAICILCLTFLVIDQYVLFSIVVFLIYLVGDLFISYSIVKHPKAYFEEVGVSEVLFEKIGYYIKFCLPLILLGFASLVFEYLDRIIIFKYASVENQGFYSLSVQFSSICLLLVSATLKPLWAEFSRLDKARKFVELRSIASKYLLSIFFVVFVVSQFIIINIDILLYVLLGDAFTDASFEVYFIILVVPFVALNQILSTILLSRNRSKIYGYLNISITVASFILFGICSFFVLEREYVYNIFLLKYICLQIFLSTGLLYACRDVLPSIRHLIILVFSCLFIGGVFQFCGSLISSDWVVLGATSILVIISIIIRGRHHVSI